MEERRAKHRQPSARTGLRRIPLLSLKEVHQEIPELSVAQLRRMIEKKELRGLPLGSGRGRTYVPLSELARLQLMVIDKQRDPKPPPLRSTEP